MSNEYKEELMFKLYGLCNTIIDIQWCSGSGATEAIASVPILQGRAPLQFLAQLLLVNFAYILQKLTLQLLLVNYQVICSYMHSIMCNNYVKVWIDTIVARMPNEHE